MKYWGIPGGPVAAPELFRALAAVNGHWTTGQVSRAVLKDERRRRAFYPWAKGIDALPFHVIVGPRQVGKTTTIGHLMQALLERGVPVNHVLYVPLDQPAIQVDLANGFEPLLEVLRRFLGLGRAEGPWYLFLDEIQAMEEWPTHLKTLYDAHHPLLRVVATGSSAAALRNPAKLPAGRWRIEELYPFKFSEAAEVLSKGDLAARRHPAWELADQARWAFASTERSHGTAEISAALDALYAALAAKEPELQAWFEHYLLHGGYPAALSATTPAEAFPFLQSLVDAAVTTDLKLFRGLRKPNQFRSFLARLGRTHGGKFSGLNIAQEEQLQKQTPARWKAVAEDAFLVRQLPALSHKGRNQPRRQDKQYIQDAGLKAFLSGEADLDALETSGRIGHVVEGVVFDHLLRLQFLGFKRLARFGYVEPPEVDFLIELPRIWLSVECKYATALSPAECARLARRTKALELDKPVVAVVITRETLGSAEGLLLVPAWLFCYMV